MEVETMSNSMTPETDAMIETDAHRIEEYSTPLTAYRRMCELAKTLERERDEWRKKAVDLHKYLIEASRMSVDTFKYDDTRDLLRDIFNLTQIGDPHPADLPMKALQAIAEMIDEHLKEVRK